MIYQHFYNYIHQKDDLYLYILIKTHKNINKIN